jgi:hypothetical protein
MLVEVESIDVLDRMTIRRKMTEYDALCVEFLSDIYTRFCTDVVMM